VGVDGLGEVGLVRINACGVVRPTYRSTRMPLGPRSTRMPLGPRVVLGSAAGPVGRVAWSAVTPLQLHRMATVLLDASLAGLWPSCYTAFQACKPSCMPGLQPRAAPPHSPPPPPPTHHPPPEQWAHLCEEAS
jgi:hypothetical protein